MNDEGIMKRGGLAHCTLAPHGISLAVEHRTIEEIWYFLQGRIRSGASRETGRKLWMSALTQT